MSKWDQLSPLAQNLLAGSSDKLVTSSPAVQGTIDFDRTGCPKTVAFRSYIERYAGIDFSVTEFFRSRTVSLRSADTGARTEFCSQFQRWQLFFCTENPGEGGRYLLPDGHVFYYHCDQCNYIEASTIEVWLESLALIDFTSHPRRCTDIVAVATQEAAADIATDYAMGEVHCASDEFTRWWQTGDLILGCRPFGANDYRLTVSWPIDDAELTKALTEKITSYVPDSGKRFRRSEYFQRFRANGDYEALRQFMERDSEM